MLRANPLVYACKIEKTTDGSWRGPCGQTRQALQIIAKGGLAKHVQIDEQSGAAQDGQDQAQREADKEKAALKIWRSLRGRRGGYSCCIVAIACLKGARLTLLVPVKG